jgi:two-component system OmpR family response regulator
MAAEVLIIEDDPRSIHLLELILRSRGYGTSVARNGDEGLVLMRSRRFDLLVLDLMLPGMDGLGILQQIRSDSQLADVPVVITSARAQATDKRGAAELGADAYLTKPYRKAELLEVVASLMGDRP